MPLKLLYLLFSRWSLLLSGSKLESWSPEARCLSKVEGRSVNLKDNCRLNGEFPAACRWPNPRKEVCRWSIRSGAWGRAIANGFSSTSWIGGGWAGFKTWKFDLKRFIWQKSSPLREKKFLRDYFFKGLQFVDWLLLLYDMVVKLHFGDKKAKQIYMLFRLLCVIVNFPLR